ncbi:MAG: GNAT family N-acetyltransferase [Paracoccaceae bacterium]
MLKTGTRINLRRLASQDLDVFHAYRSDAKVAQFQDWSQMSRPEALQFLQSMASDPLFQNGHWSQIAIADADDDRLLGDLGIHISQSGVEAELGISLSSAAQGRGLGEEACRLAFDLIWDTTLAQAIRIWTLKANVAAQALCSRLPLEALGLETTTGEDGKIVEEFAYRIRRPE